MLARREDYGKNADGTPTELPDGVLVLTAGLDTQNNRMEYEVVGHGYQGETWGIEKGVVMGKPYDPETWAKLDEMVFDRVFRFKDGIGLRVSMSFVDEGGQFAQHIRLNCQKRISKKVFCIKGFGGQDKPYTSPPKQMRILIDKRMLGTCWQYQLGVDSGKQIIMDNLNVKKPGARYCHFPARDDYGAAYFTGLLSEKLEYNPKKKVHPWEWVKLPGHERNEPLDCRNYALAAFEVLPVQLDAVERRLLAARGKVTASTAQPLKPAARKLQKPKLSKYYDDW